MARTVLEVVVAGDSKSLERSMSRSSKSVDRFGKDADRSLKKASKGFSGIGKAASLAGGALAGAGLAATIKGVTNAAIESEKSTVKMRAQLTASGLSYKKYAGEIDRVIQKQSRLAAVDDEDLQDAFTNIVRTTGDVSKSLNLVGLASDVARAKNLDLAKAGDLVAKVAGGNTSVLSRYGITMKDGATATEALGTLQQRFGGQAEAYGKSTAGANDRFRVAVENLQEKLGAKLLPTLASVAAAGTRFVDQMESGTGAGGRFASIIGTVAESVKRVVGTIGGFVKGFREGNAAMVALGITAAGLVAGFVAFKVVTTVVAAMTALKAAVIGVNIAMRANPFVAVATVVAALGVALVVAYKKSETFRNVVDGVFRAVKVAVGDSIAFVLRTLDKFLGGISSVASVAGSLPGVGKIFDGMADKVDRARKAIRGAADQADRLGKIKVDTSEIDEAIRKAGGLKSALKDSAVRLTATPRKDAGDLPAGSNPGGLLGGLSAGARGVYGNVSRLFGGVRMTSGYRSPAHNRAVGGAPNSDHLTGNALDLVPTDGWNAKSIARFDRIAAWAKRRGLFVGWRGLANHGPGNHLHLSYRGRQTAQGQRGEVGDLGVAGLKKLALGQGLSENAASTAAAVGMAESGGNPRASNRNSNGSIDRGLWQINSVHGALSTFDVAKNARAMSSISRKGSTWKPWVAYNSGAYKRFLPAARAAKATKTAARKTVMTSKMGASSVVPLNEVEQARADALAEQRGYVPSGGGSFGGDIDAGGGLGGDAAGIDANTQALIDNTQAQLAAANALVALKDVALKEAQDRARLGQTELGVLKNALAEVVNGNLGGRIGLGFQSAGWAGGTARY